jgi:hypothetical protein
VTDVPVHIKSWGENKAALCGVYPGGGFVVEGVVSGRKATCPRWVLEAKLKLKI